MSKEAKRIQRATERAAAKMGSDLIWYVMRGEDNVPEIGRSTMESIVGRYMLGSFHTFRSFTQARDFAAGQLASVIKQLQREARRIRSMKKSEVK